MLFGGKFKNCVRVYACILTTFVFAAWLNLDTIIQIIFFYGRREGPSKVLIEVPPPELKNLPHLYF